MFFQMLPYILYFIIYFIYALVIFDIDQEMEEDGSEQIIFNVFDKVWLVLLLLFSFFFLKQEWRQVKNKKWEYLYDFWNYADIIPPISIFIIVIADIFSK